MTSSKADPEMIIFLVLFLKSDFHSYFSSVLKASFIFGIDNGL